jgi:hypothetical protein
MIQDRTTWTLTLGIGKQTAGSVHNSRRKEPDFWQVDTSGLSVFDLCFASDLPLRSANLLIREMGEPLTVDVDESVASISVRPRQSNRMQQRECQFIVIRDDGKSFISSSLNNNISSDFDLIA